jgi:peptidoglycan/xylan/chitin deacetylase (PgdA/CDA1 family)
MPDAQAARRVAHVPILMYHYVSVPPLAASRYRLDLSVTPQNFEAQVKYLSDNGYTTIDLEDLYNYLATGARLPAKPVILTFDDGYRDAYDVVFPVLTRYKMKATFFVVSDFAGSGNPAFMDWIMVKALSDAGMRIESHSRTHDDMRKRTFQNLVWEVLGPIEAITAYTGKRPHFFCYPFGKFDDDVIRVLKSVDTWAAMTTESGKTQQLSNAMTWSRLRVHGSTSLDEFATLLRAEG